MMALLRIGLSELARNTYLLGDKFHRAETAAAEGGIVAPTDSGSRKEPSHRNG